MIVEDETDFQARNRDSFFNSIQTDFCGKGKVPKEDLKWSAFLKSKDHIFALNGSEPEFLAFCRLFVQAKSSNGNLLVLIELLVNLLLKVKDSALGKKHSPTPALVEQCCVALHFCSLCFNYVTSTQLSEGIADILGLNVAWPDVCISENDIWMKCLIDETLHAISYSSITGRYNLADVHFFCCNLQLALFSSQLYQTGFARKSFDGKELFVRYVFEIAARDLQVAMGRPDGDISESLAARLVKGLVAAVSQPVEPQVDSVVGLLAQKYSQAETSESQLERRPLFNASENVTDLFRGAIMTIIGLPFQSFKIILRNFFTDSSKDGVLGSSCESMTDIRLSMRYFPKFPLSERSLNLLLLLLHNHRRYNPFREVFSILHDERQEDGAISDGKLISAVAIPMRKVHADFNLILEVLTNNLPSESATLFLYSFLQTHPAFMEVICNVEQTKVERRKVKYNNVVGLVSSLLKGLYDVKYTKSIDHLYILVVCVLILVQDKVVCLHLSSTISSVDWYREHHIQNFPMLDLILLCTLRTVMHALFRIKDNYLVYNCFAVVLNLAPSLVDIHNYTAERVVRVFTRLCKWIVKRSSEVTKDSISLHVDKQQTNTSNIPRDAVEETLRVLMKVFRIALQETKRSKNIYLIYALVHQSEDLLPLLRHPAVLKIFDEIVISTEQASIQLEMFQGPKDFDAFICYHIHIVETVNENGTTSADQVILALKSQIEKECCKGSSIEENCTYVYEEGENPEEFFLPFAWVAAVRASPEINWYVSCMTLINPESANLVDGGNLQNRNVSHYDCNIPISNATSTQIKSFVEGGISNA